MNETREYEILGHKVRLNASTSGGPCGQEVVEAVNAEVNKLREMRPDLDSTQVFLLVSLTLASEKLSLEKEYKQNVDKLHITAKDALNILDEYTSGQQKA